jgi:23S rRNA (uracil1939-C5)-methyltransferase
MSANEFILEMEKMVFGGNCIGRLPDGRAAFVPYTLPAERVRVRVVQEKRNHVLCELIEVLTPAPDRIAPRCAHFGLCGGCHYQHLDYAAQLKAKTAILRDQMERIGGWSDLPLDPIVPSPQVFNYRNHIQFHLNAAGQVGFEAAGSHTIVPIRECHLPDAAINEIWPLLEMEFIPGLERVALRAGSPDDIQLILESSDPEPVEFSVEDLPISAVHLGPGGALVLAGEEQVIITILDRPFQVSAGAFFQVNSPQAAAMVQYLLTNLPLPAGATVLDVYCGVGLFSAFIAPHCTRLVGIEASAAACEDFAANLDEFDHVALYAAPAEEVLPYVAFQPDAILVDPPRAGLSPEAMDGLLAQGASWIAYISCDPATLARDSRKLASAGYHLERLTPFDLFPQTYHIESISLWKKVAKQKS